MMAFTSEPPGFAICSKTTSPTRERTKGSVNVADKSVESVMVNDLAVSDLEKSKVKPFATSTPDLIVYGGVPLATKV